MNFWIAYAIAFVAWWNWLLIALAAYAIYAVARAWPLLWAMTSSNPTTGMKRVLAVATRCYEKGKSRRAATLAQGGLTWFAGEPEEAKMPEIRRLGSDLAALGSFAHGRLNDFQIAEMWAHNSVLRDGTNPLAYEALGLALACNGHTDKARAKFMEGLSLAQGSQPVDTEGEERINRQFVWLNEHESTINEGQQPFT